MEMLSLKVSGVKTCTRFIHQLKITVHQQWEICAAGRFQALEQLQRTLKFVRQPNIILIRKSHIRCGRCSQQTVDIADAAKISIGRQHLQPVSIALPQTLNQLQRAIGRTVVTHQQALGSECLLVDGSNLLCEISSTVVRGENNLDHQSAQPHLRK